MQTDTKQSDYTQLKQIDYSRVFARQFGEYVLVIDQKTGRWVFIREIDLPILRIAKSMNPNCEHLFEEANNVLQRVNELELLLVHNEVGILPRPDPTSLNTLILKLTKRCNIACNYCYDFENGDTAINANQPDLLRAINEALKANVDGTLYIILHGGEPMLVWDTIEFLVIEGKRLAKKAGVNIKFQGQTNLTNLTERKVAFSKKHEIAWGVSLDGPPALNDKTRQHKNGDGTYYLFQRALLKYGDFVHQFPVLSTITSNNAGSLLEIARYFRDVGMSGWDWTLFQPIGRARKLKSYNIDSDTLLLAWQQLFKAVEFGEFDGFPVKPVLRYLDNFIKGPGSDMCLRPKCGAARDLLSISYDGAIEACDCLDRQGPFSPIGYINKMSLNEARKSDIANTIRSRDTLSGHCHDCLWYGVCGGTCLAHSGGIQSVAELHCNVSQLAFHSIANSMANSKALLNYWESLQ